MRRERVAVHKAARTGFGAGYLKPVIIRGSEVVLQERVNLLDLLSPLVVIVHIMEIPFGGNERLAVEDVAEIAHVAFESGNRAVVGMDVGVVDVVEISGVLKLLGGAREDWRAADDLLSIGVQRIPRGAQLVLHIAGE